MRLFMLLSYTQPAGISAIAVVPGPNFFYLTGMSFHLSERPTLAILRLDGDPILICPALERNKAQSGPMKFQVFCYDDVTGPAGAFRDAFATAGLKDKTLGVEGRRIRFLELDLIAKSGNAPRIVPCDGCFAAQRMSKDASELALMRKAIAIAEQALTATMPKIRVGVTEKEIAAELTLNLLRGGADVTLPFAPIVATGPNGGDPHANPSDRKLESGDLVTLDWGAFYDGYASDLTRAFAIGKKPRAELVRAYEAVQAANAAGRAAAKPGATGQDVDRAARKVIVDAGLGEYFVHRTGHGLGLEIHEEPDMKEGSLAPLTPGVTFTVEPGVYLPGIGGVRIEDDVAITESGSETLTTLPRDLQVVG